jgi:hypothetical protein
VLHLEKSLLWCRNLGSSERRSEIPEKVWNVVLEKDGDDLDRSCEKGESIAWSQGGKECATYSKK